MEGYMDDINEMHLETQNNLIFRMAKLDGEKFFGNA